jgi:hypothetical protein
MKRIILCLLLYTCTAQAQTWHMNIRLKGGGTTSIPLQEIRKLTFSPVTDVREEKWATVIRTFTLLQNYPNPFNPSTTVEYMLPASGNVEIRVFDLNGRLVRSLENGFQPQGEHRAIWDGRDDGGTQVASGPYFCHVTFGNAALSKKMLLIK